MQAKIVDASERASSASAAAQHHHGSHAAAQTISHQPLRVEPAPESVRRLFAEAQLPRVLDGIMMKVRSPPSRAVSSWRDVIVGPR